MLSITEELLAKVDASVSELGCRLLTKVRPVLSGVVRRGTTHEFVTLVVQLSKGEKFLLSDKALDQLTNITKVPRSLINELPDDLIWGTLTAQIRKRWSNFTGALVSGHEVIAWVAPHWQGIDLPPSKVIEACLEGMKAREAMFLEEPRGGFRQRYLLTCSGLEYVFRKSPHQNDKHHFAVGVEVDYTGWKMPEIYAYGFRLVCANGLVVPMRFEGSERKLWADEPARLLKRFSAISAETVSFIRMTLIPNLEKSIQRRPPDPDARLRRLLARLPERIRPLVDRAYKAEDLGGSDYQLMNALTRAARHSQCPEDWRPRLMSLAGEITAGSRCPSCFQAVKVQSSSSK